MLGSNVITTAISDQTNQKKVFKSFAL